MSHLQGEVEDAVQEARNAEEKAKKAITDVGVYFRIIISLHYFLQKKKKIYREDIKKLQIS